MKNLDEILESELLGQLFFNEPMSRHTTFRIGGEARYFYLATSEEDFLRAINATKKLSLPFYILGGGSNVIFSDAKYNGLIIKYQLSNIIVQKIIGSKKVFLTVSAGTPTGLVLNKALKENLTGLEFLAGIPGVIGGAVVANAHAFFLGKFYDYPKTLVEHIEEIEILTQYGTREIVSPERYEWTLHGSNVEEFGDIILRVKLRVEEGVPFSSEEYLKEYEEFRRDKPYTKFPSAGSIFRNYSLKQGEEVKNFSTISEKDLSRVQSFLNKGILPAGWLIQMCGLLGHTNGSAQISAEHGNFIVNKGNATASQVLALIDLSKKSVYDRFGILLQEEVKIIR